MSGNDLDHLKSLLLKSEQDRIDLLEQEIERLKQRLEDKDQLLNTLKPLLSELLQQKIRESRSEMAEALAPVMGEAIKRQIRDSRDEVVDAIYPVLGSAIKKQVSEAKEEVADALYPVIGRTIRKSIAEAMKTLIESINQRLNETFNFKKWWLLLKSRLTGVSPGEFIVAGLNSFDVYEILFIHRKSGILLTHYGNPAHELRADTDLVGGMLTAIQDFARDTFNWDEGEELSEIQYLEHQIYLDAMPHSLLALVGKGIPPKNLRSQIKSSHERLHKQHAANLRTFNGNTDSFSDLNEPLSELQQQLVVKI